MKNLFPRLALAVILGSLLLSLQPVLAQGSLTPPGPPAPTMITLNQIEPRTPIASAGFTITNSGSYYLTTNITTSFYVTTAISILASGVTLDLNGFTIVSSANFDAEPGLGGIELGSGLSDITIFNGHIRGGITYNSGTGTYSQFGFGDGINYSGTQPRNVRVSGVSVTGCYLYGINLGIGSSTEVESCTVQTVGSYGIEAAGVFRSAAYACGLNAIMANNASDCYGYSTGGDGLNVSQMANNCYGYSTGGDGLDAGTANNCWGYSTDGDGMDVNQTANNCYGVSSSNGNVYGLYANNANNCSGLITGYSDAFSAYGLYANGTATGCSGTNNGYIGLHATTAVNCYGYSGGNVGHGAGVDAITAQNCYGLSIFGGNGVNATIAIGCYGQANAGSGVDLGYGVNATIANSCYSSTGDGAIANKYNMP